MTEQETGTKDSQSAGLPKAIADLAAKAAGKRYIYRGENKKFDTVSSSLYRKYKDINENGIARIQEEILEQAMSHSRTLADTEPEAEILAEFRHNGGTVNIIDFTDDYLIALFFACDGRPEEPGQVHLLPTIGNTYSTHRPIQPLHKTTAQKSVQIIPDAGFIEPEATIPIEAEQKPVILQHLRLHHGINCETIYNDLYGVIQHQGIHPKAYEALHRGVALEAMEKPDEAITQFKECLRLNSEMGSARTRLGDAYLDKEEHEAAITQYEEALTFNPMSTHILDNIAIAHARKGDHTAAINYYNQSIRIEFDDFTHYLRFESLLISEAWEEAENTAEEGDITWTELGEMMKEEHQTIANFEQKNGIAIPDNIKHRLN